MGQKAQASAGQGQGGHPDQRLPLHKTQSGQSQRGDARHPVRQAVHAVEEVQGVSGAHQEEQGEPRGQADAGYRSDAHPQANGDRGPEDLPQELVQGGEAAGIVEQADGGQDAGTEHQSQQRMKRVARDQASSPGHR